MDSHSGPETGPEKITNIAFGPLQLLERDLVDSRNDKKVTLTKSQAQIFRILVERRSQTLTIERLSELTEKSESILYAHISSLKEAILRLVGDECIIERDPQDPSNGYKLVGFL